LGTKPLTLNLIGCGKTGSVLAYLWNRARTLRIGSVLTRSIVSATQAVEKIGTGTPVSSYQELGAADWTMLAVPDQQLEQVAAELAQTDVVTKDSVVFHLSGALESSILTNAGLHRGNLASVHPLRSFADFDTSVVDFTGTWCGYEGSVEIQPSLAQAFEHIGARMFNIKPNCKLFYHGASVMVSNYVNALVESGLKTYQRAGIDRDIALNLIGPVLRNTCDNIISSDPGRALTGPIARGDWRIVRLELQRLESADPDLAQVYKVMGKATLELAEAEGLLTTEQALKLHDLLS